ncbi:MAG: exodeoxyribonuclease III [Parcubacteria group bacterium]
MKIISWNINGLRAILKKNFSEFLNEYQPDILGLQEIKISEEARLKENLDFSGYKVYFNSAKRPGYSGTALLIKEEYANRVVGEVKNLLGEDIFDSEGRVQVLELEKFYVINCYFPNSAHGLKRLDYKRSFNAYMLKNIKKLERKKPVLLMGDLNVAHQEIDLARPKDNIGNPGFTYEEREDMDSFVKHGLVDTFRYLYPQKVQYSWWSYRTRARLRNIGWRIDYLCVSAKLLRMIEDSYILDEVWGSDHAPVGVKLKEA